MPHRLEQLINTGHLLVQATFADLDVDAVLDQRDSDPFDSAWRLAFENIEATKKHTVIAANDALRERAFILVYQHGPGGELAAYVSDDFGLLHDALALGSVDFWLAALLRCYLDGRFPCGEIVPLDCTLDEVLDPFIEDNSSE